MASTGKKNWAGMNVALYQEHGGSRPKQHAAQVGEKKEDNRRKHPLSGRPWVCWPYNEGGFSIKG